MRPETSTVSPLRAGILPPLVLLSGFCGISYEILYTRLLGNLLGNQFTINATVLLTFLLGIGLGTLYAHRYARWLWLIELGIGVYAAVFALVFPFVDAVIYRYLPFLGTSIYAAALASLVLLAAPAFLIGCSVPLFAGYVGTLRKAGVFSLTYGIYNVGAALTALAMEFMLLRAFGIRGATLVTAVLNALVAFALYRLALAPPPVADPRSGWRFPRRVLAALALASVVSAVFQLLMIKLAEFVFGPYNETFALVLATVLLGIALGSFLAGRFGLGFTGALLLALGGLVWILLGLSRVVAIYASLYEGAASSYGLLVLLKFGLVFALMGPAATGFGATIPALLRAYRDVARESGQLLFVSSIANAGGFLLMAFVLHRWLDYGPLLLILAGLLIPALWIHRGFALVSTVTAGTLVTVAGLAFFGVWNEMLLYAGHLSFRSPEKLESQLASTLMADRYKGAEDVFAITWVDDVPYFFLNGFISIPLGGEKSTEEIVGALSAMYAPRLDRAMVLGMGSGATAGTVSLVFDEVDVIEINNVILQNLDLLAPYNFDIATRPGVDIVHDDGIHFIRTTEERYSLILNTVTSPQFFSSSKLYTADFFGHVKPRLAEGGVYVTWIDGMIGDRGVDIILDTLATSFADCWLNYLTDTYHFLVCSDAPLAMRQVDAVAAQPVLRRYFADDFAVAPRMLPYSVLSTEALALRSDPAGRPVRINRIDHPVLEFEMARLARAEGGFDRYLQRIEERVDLEALEADITPEWDWTRGGFVFFGDLRAEPGWPLDDILRAAERRHPIDPAEYDRAAAAYVADVGSPAARVLAGKALLARDRFAAAADLLAEPGERAKAPEAAAVAYYLGVAYEGLDDAGKAAEAYREALRHDPSARLAQQALRRLTASGGVDGGAAGGE